MPLDAADAPADFMSAQSIAHSLDTQGEENCSLPGVSAQTHVFSAVFDLARILTHTCAELSYLESQGLAAALSECHLH